MNERNDIVILVNKDTTPDLSQLALQLGGDLVDNHVDFNNDLGTGTIQSVQLEHGLSLFTYETNVSKNIRIQVQSNVEENFLVISYDQHGLNLTLNEIALKNNGIESTKSGVLLTTSNSQARFNLLPNKQSVGMKLFISQEWLMNYSGSIRFSEDFLSEFLKSKEHNQQVFEYLNDELLECIQVLYNNMNEPNTVFFISHIFHLVNDVLKNLSFNSFLWFGNLPDKEVKHLIHARNILVHDFNNTPLKITELARIANMSCSRFIRLFKHVFGVTCHQYFQTARMTKAFQLIQSNKYAIYEVSQMVGYQHHGKFSQAFKRIFNKSPNEIKCQNRLI